MRINNFVGVALLIVALSIAYYFGIFLPQLETSKLKQSELLNQQKQISKSENIKSLESCLMTVGINAAAFWNSECVAKGLNENCLLPQYNVDRADENRKEYQELCFKRYPQN